MGIIYKITNMVNNKIYIGQTTYSASHRLKQHINSAMHNSGCPYLGKAIRKYKPENFVIDTIEENIPYELLNDREIYWIEYYNSNDSNIGYNLTRGGNLNSFSISLEDEKIINDLWNSGKTIGQIYDITQHAIKTIDRVLLTNNTYSVSEAMKRSSSKAKSVCQYSLCGELLNRFDSLSDAANVVNGNYQSIGQACINKITAYGYQWRYECDDPPEKINYDNYSHIQRPVIQMSKDEKIIYQRFESANDAAKYLGKKYSGDILECCKGKRKSVYGFKWKFCDVDFQVQKIHNIPTPKLQKQPRKVICINNLIIFNTLKEAQNYCNLSSSGQITKVCEYNKSTLKFDRYAGKDSKTNERLTWMYYKDYIQLVQNEKQL